MADDKLREELIERGTSWLLEMELIDTPQLKNFLYLNTYNSSKRIKDVELLIDTRYKVMLVYLKLDLLGRLRRQEREIEEHLLEQYANILPSFRVRIVYDRRIFDMALAKVAERTKGGKDEKPTGDGGNFALKQPSNPAPSGHESTGQPQGDHQSNVDAPPAAPSEEGKNSDGTGGGDSHGGGEVSTPSGLENSGSDSQS